MAQELSEKELLKMEVEQLKKEVKEPKSSGGPSSFLPAASSLSLSGPHGDGMKGRCDEQQGGGTFQGSRKSRGAPGMGWEVGGGRGLIPQKCTRDNLQSLEGLVCPVGYLD